MTTTRRAYCPQCGARLRRGQPIGALCDPCHRGDPDPRQVLPPDFYDQARIVAPLAVYDFGVFFRRLRTQADWSQQTLGNMVDLHQAQISSIERGVYRLRDIEIIARLSTRLAIPPVRLGFPDIRTTVTGGMTNGRKAVSQVDRRDLGQHIAGLVLGAVGTAGLDVDRLIALLPHSEPTATLHVGASDVEAIEQVTAAFVRQDFAGGSGLIRDAAVAQLGAVVPLLNAQVSSRLRPRLLLAASRLATQAGYMSFQIRQHDAARQLWMIGLDIARKTDHPLGTDQTVFLLYDMALQAVHLGRPKEALHLIQIGQSTAVDRYPVSPSTMCILVNIEARAHAAQRDMAGCDRALGQGVDHFGAIDSAKGESWTDFLDEAMLAGYQGAVHYELAQAGRDPRAADRAVLLLRQAVDHLGPEYTGSRALRLPDLAGTHALAGDTDTAVAIGHQAIDVITAVSCPRAYDRLRVLNTVLEPLHTSPGVADLRDRIVVNAT